jgi:hypothetical protein
MTMLGRVALVGAAIALLTGACGDTGSGTAASTTTGDGPTITAPAGSTAAATALAEVPKALQFTASGVDGGKVVGADFAGKDVALWFWAPW